MQKATFENAHLAISKEPNPSYLIFILIISILALIALTVETVFSLDQSTMQVLGYIDSAICILFFIDFLIQFFQAKNKFKYFITWGWLDLLSSIPMLTALRFGRMARIVRIFRVFRGIQSARFITKVILEKRAQSTMLAVILIAIVIVGVSAISILRFESTADGNIKTAEDAIWWAVVTITTVGYGDKYPITTEGRIIATMLMIAGVGLFGTISGFVASWLVSPSEPKRDTKDNDIVQELEEIKQLLSDLKKNKTP